MTDDEAHIRHSLGLPLNISSAPWNVALQNPDSYVYSDEFSEYLRMQVIPLTKFRQFEGEGETEIPTPRLTWWRRLIQWMTGS